MSTKDYLTRYFQQLGKVLAVLMGLRENKKYELAIDEINQVLDTWFNLPEAKIDSVDSNDLLNLLTESNKPNFDKVKAVAELLYQKVITYNEMGKSDDAVRLAPKALELFRVYDVQSGQFSIDIQQRIAELDKMVSGAYSV